MVNLENWNALCALYRTVFPSVSHKVKDQIQSVLGTGGTDADGDQQDQDTTDASRKNKSAAGEKGSEKCTKTGKHQLTGKKLALKKKLWTAYSSSEKECLGRTDMVIHSCCSTIHCQISCCLVT